MAHVSMSCAERNNLNVRMHTRRMTRLTNAFSKKMENHAHALAVHFLYYNFGRIHKTLETTPAMAASVTDRLWELVDMVGVLEAWEALSEPTRDLPPCVQDADRPVAECDSKATRRLEFAIACP